MGKWNDETNGDDLLEVYENLELGRFNVNGCLVKSGKSKATVEAL